MSTGYDSGGCYTPNTNEANVLDPVVDAAGSSAEITGNSLNNP